MLYKEAARILERVRKKEGSVKSLVLASEYKNIKQLYALVCETLKYREVIFEILQLSELLKKERKAFKKDELALVLVYDFLFGKGVHSGLQKSLKDAITRNKSALNAGLAKMKIKYKVARNEDLLKVGKNVNISVRLPRYVRINLIKTTVADVCEHFVENEGYSQLDSDGISYGQYINLMKNLEAKTFVIDPHLRDLLVFPHGCDLHAHPLYVSGHIILQDKASCLPAHCLNPPANAHVFDTCAAPGNKTSHLASLMGNIGKIFSFDLDAKRAATMRKLLTSANVRCSKVKVMDFLKVKTDDKLYKDVQYAIVDPSCSGSGIVSRLDHLTNDDNSHNSKRLDNLAAFQSAILMHTLSFPNMKKVVYSTCSIHEQENEKVVEKVLKSFGNKFELEEILASVPSRGHSIFPGAEKSLRLSPETDATNGFFVVCFQRKYENTANNSVEQHETAHDSTVESSTNHHGKKRNKRRKRTDTVNNEHLETAKCNINNKTIQSKKKKKRKSKPQPVTGKA